MSPDKINLSTLKGEGQLTNLELDEEVLQSLLDLPTWLAINHVGCNRAAIRIPWTKLKTHPICLTLDKVVMEMSTCDEPRPPNGPSPIATASGQSEYGFAEKVVEGMSLSINSIVIRISAKAFNASFELSQLQVYSVNPSWSIGDLRFTRIQDPQRGEILTFKEISWQMIRIEADAIQSAEHEVISAPIRLITNQSKIRVTLKRRIKDCNVVASKLILILDDLLWVLTDSQLKAMVQYAKSLSDAMEKSAQQRKSMATEDEVSSSTTQSTQQLRTQQASTAADQSATMAKLFSDYDVWETSHHLQIKHLDLHICDDIHAKDKAINKRVTGGAMQLSFSSITLDYYPLHKAGGSCLHWMHYGEATKARESWARRLLEEFRSNVEMLKSAVKDQQSSTPVHSSSQHSKINTSSSFSPPPPQTPKSQLMSSSLVLRMADFSIYQVSTADQRRSSPKAMISCNKKSLYLPPEMPAIHVEFTEYYFPDGKDYPIPCPNLFAQLNALQLVLDPRSLVWLNLFALDLRQSLEQFMEIYKLNDSQKPEEHVDIKVDGLMLKLVIPTDRDPSSPADLPHSISVQTSEMVATNTRHPANCTRSCLETLLQNFQEQDFFSSSILSFPRSPSSLPLLHPVFHHHSHEQDTRLHDIYKGLTVPTMSTDSLKMPAASDFWALHFAQFWMDYEGRGRPQPFVDSFPLTVWACQPAKLLQHQHNRKDTPGSGLSRSTSADGVGRLQRKRLLKEYYSSEGAPPPSPSNKSSLPSTNGLNKPLSLDSLMSTSSTKDANVHMLVHVHKPLSAQVSHRQYMFLMQLQRSLKALKQTLQQDLEEMSSKKDRKDACPVPDQEPFTACLGLLLQSAEVSLFLKPVPQPEGSLPTSELSPSESRGTLDPPREPADGADRVSEEASGRSESGAVKGQCTVDQLLCGEILEDEVSQGRPPLLPASSTTCSDSNHKVSVDERTSAKNSGKWISEEGKLIDGLGGVSELSEISKSQNWDPLCDTLSGTDSNDKDKNASGKMAHSVSSGRLMRDRSQSNFSVSYKNMKKSPSLQSLDNISIDSCMEDGDPYSLLERDDVSISGFKDVMNEQCAAESAMDNATEAMTCREQEGGVSPDTVSATSQSIDEPTKDTVSVLLLKVQSVCVGMEAVGENTVAALEVGRVTSNQLGNVSLRQYLSNRSLAAGEVLSGSRGFHGPEVCARLESGPSAAAHSELAKRNGFLTLHLRGYHASFLMSTLRNMAHFLEDYSAPQVLPMEISVMDTHIKLKDDDPSDGPPNIEPAPITFHVDGLMIHRKDDGSFTLGVDNAAEDKSRRERRLTDTCLTPVPEADGNICGISKATQTSAAPSSPQPSSKEKMLTDENECLKVELSRAKMALAEAQMEKDSLLHRLKSLKVSPS